MLTQTDMPRLWGSQEISIGTCKLRSQQLHHSQLLEVSTTELAMSPALVLTWCRDDNRNWNNINRRLWDCGTAALTCKNLWWVALYATDRAPHTQV